jgi:hypothetical protein
VRENLKDRKHHLMFSEWLCDGDFIICPRIDFEVGVRVLGGLLSLGYSIGFHVQRTSRIFRWSQGVVISLDKVSSLPLPYIQIKGSDRRVIVSNFSNFFVQYVSHAMQGRNQQHWHEARSRWSLSGLVVH